MNYFSERDLDGKTAINIQARTRKELKEIIPGLAKKHPNID